MRNCSTCRRRDIGRAMSAFDAVAPDFDRGRLLPSGVAEAVRSAILASIDAPGRPRVLDLGAGTGRIGKAFVAAGDAYFGADLSFGMLREFFPYSRNLVQTEGEQLPFSSGTFDVVMLIHVLSGSRGRRRLLAEARRVLRPEGVLAVGQTVSPPEGIDAQLKKRLAAILEDMAVEPHRSKGRDEALSWLESASRRRLTVVAASWNARRTPRDFLVRHRTGARFSALPAEIQGDALERLGVWAEAAFGSLDANFAEDRRFELNMFKF